MVKEISQESSLINILNNEEPDWCDYPYIGIGKKPMSKNKKCIALDKIEY